MTTYKETIVPAKRQIEVPLDLQAAAKVIERQGGKDSDDIHEAMMRAAGTLAEASGHVKTATEKIMANQLKPQIENLAATRRRVREIHDSAARKVVDIRDRVDRKIADLEAAVLPPAPKDAMAMVYAGEVRTAIARMPANERIKAARDAVEQADEAFVAAVVTGSPTLTGMTATELEVVRDMWRRKHHGETVARTRRLRAAQSHLDRLNSLFSKWTGSIYAEKDAAIAAAEKSAELAQAAMANVAGAS